ncbi:MAG TPA: diguanylate cyclase [Burkholderiales bacterium]|nr:diguanylate cyclase [Burkholderiales bacterium]
MNAPKFTIARKFMLLLVVFLALQVLQLGFGLRQVRHVAEEAEHLSDAGKVRPLLLAELARRSLAPDGGQTAHQKFLDMLAAHDHIHRQLAEEFGKRAGDPEYAELARLIAEAGNAWEQELRPLLLAVDPAQPVAARAALARYETIGPAQATRFARLVTLFEAHLRAEAHETLRNHGFIFILSILLAVAAVILVRRQFTLPLRALDEASRAMAEGNYDRRLTVTSRDELGELAGAFNRMAGAVEERTSQLSALNQVAIAITSSPSLKDILNEIMRSGIQLTVARAACIAFYDQGAGRFREWVTLGLSEHFVQNMTFRPGGLADETFTAAMVGTYILSNDRPGTKHKLTTLTRDEGIKCFICLPLTSHAHHLGVIYVYRDDRDMFESSEIELLTTFARLAAETIESARLRERLAGEARTDVLTGLYNRREFEQRLAEEHARAKRYNKPYVFMMLDIDHFKQVNDVHGHAAGDIVLKTLAEVLRKQLRDADIPARYGGEEFAVIFPEINDTAAKQVAERMRRAIAAMSFRLPDGREINMTVSIGMSSHPKDADTPREVVDRADRALYAAKEAGRNRVVIHGAV